MTKSSFWLCPLCKAPLQRIDKQFQCENHHSYDIAKQGYVNLMLANQKRSKVPGDNKNMVEARRRFLNRGHYDFLIQAIESVITREKSSSTKSILDVGCGEGYYVNAVSSCFEIAYGVDISKDAIKRAAGAYKTIHFATASAYSLPVADRIFDWVLSVFAPVSVKELRRVLKPEGRLVRVLPGQRHLFQIKQALYENPSLHEAPNMLDGAVNIQRESVRATVDLDNASLSDLLTMTPLLFKGSEQGKETLLKQDSVEMDFDFDIQVMQFDD